MNQEINKKTLASAITNTLGSLTGSASTNTVATAKLSFDRHILEEWENKEQKKKYKKEP